MLHQREEERPWVLTEALGFVPEPVREAELSFDLVLVEAVYHGDDVVARVRV